MSQDFERLMLPHLDAAYGLAFWLTRDAAAAQDVVQDSYLRAFKAFSGFKPGNARAWLLTIVRRQSLDWLKANRGRQHIDINAEDDLTADDQAYLSDTDTAEAGLIRRQSRQKVTSAIANLAPAFREVIVLKDIEDMSYKDIAKILGIPIGTVMSRLARGRDMLRLVLTAQGEGVAS